jgi:glucokinase
MRVLAGDIGGTHARLAVVDLDESRVRIVREARYASSEYPSLAPIVRAFLAAGSETPARAAFGVAGPVSDGRVSTPNLPWTLDEGRLARETGLPRVRLLNDLDAIGRGIARLDVKDLVTLQGGVRDEDGTVAIIGAGTGLGEAFVAHDGRRRRTHASEGGHAGFAPRTALERELLDSLAGELGHVSGERVISGPGLERIYRFFAQREPAREQRAVRDAVDKEGAAAVSRHGLDKSDALCVEALDLFVGAYGATAGNLALTVLATGGVFIVGGIAPAIVEKLMDGTFLAAFRDKGRMSEMMERMPVRVVMNDDVGLYGAASAAAEDDARTSDAPRAPSASGAPQSKAHNAGAR